MIKEKLAGIIRKLSFGALICLSFLQFATASEITSEVDADRSGISSGFFGDIELQIAMSEAVPVKVRYLKNPYRIVLEFDGLNLSQLPLDFGAKARRIENLNFGQLTEARARMVLTFKRPHKLVELDVSSGAVAGSPGMLARFGKIDEIAYLELVERLGYKADDVQYSLPEISKGEDELPLIVIDPGHGGVDPGAIRNGVSEKDVTLRASKLLAERIKATGRYRIAMTREVDEFVPLVERRRMGERLKADLYISIHADTVEVGDAQGTTIYLLSQEASTENAAKFARFENRVDIFAGEFATEEETDINIALLSLAQQSTNEKSRRFAEILRHEWKSINDAPAHSRIESAGFAVLKAPEIPSLLLEIGYLSNAVDFMKIQDEAWLDEMAQGVIRALDQQFPPNE